MKRSMLRGLLGLGAIVAALAMAPSAVAGSAGEPAAGASAAGSSTGSILDHLAAGWSGVGFGLGVSPLRESLGPAAVPGAVGSEGVRPLDADPRGGILSFDLKLAWPGAASTSAVEPYLAFGPALIVVEPDSAGRLLGTRVDSTLRLGARAGAGLNWRVGKNATLFGAYEVTTAGQGGLSSPGARTPADAEVNGYDLTYGLRFRY